MPTERKRKRPLMYCSPFGWKEYLPETHEKQLEEEESTDTVPKPVDPETPATSSPASPVCTKEESSSFCAHCEYKRNPHPPGLTLDEDMVWSVPVKVGDFWMDIHYPVWYSDQDLLDWLD